MPNLWLYMNELFFHQTIEDSRFESLSSMDGLRASVPAKQTLLVETEGAVKKQIETAISEGIY